MCARHLTPVLLGLVAGCVPDLARECADDADCPDDRPACFAGVCTTDDAVQAHPGLDADAGVAGGPWPFGGPDASPDAAGAPWPFGGQDASPDAAGAPWPFGEQDAYAADEEPPAERPAPPGPACAEAHEEHCNGEDDDCDGRVDERPGDCPRHDDGRGRGRGRDCEEDDGCCDRDDGCDDREAPW